MMCFLATLLITVLPADETHSFIGKWSVIRFTRGEINYPKSLVSNMTAYFTDKHLLIRHGDVIGELDYTIVNDKEALNIDLVANDGSKKGIKTLGIYSYDKTSKQLTLYISLKPNIRPTKIPADPEDEHELIILKVHEPK